MDDSAGGAAAEEGMPLVHAGPDLLLALGLVVARHKNGSMNDPSSWFCICQVPFVCLFGGVEAFLGEFKVSCL